MVIEQSFIEISHTGALLIDDILLKSPLIEIILYDVLLTDAGIISGFLVDACLIAEVDRIDDIFKQRLLNHVVAATDPLPDKTVSKLCSRQNLVNAVAYPIRTLANHLRGY